MVGHELSKRDPVTPRPNLPAVRALFISFGPILSEAFNWFNVNESHRFPESYLSDVVDNPSPLFL